MANYYKVSLEVMILARSPLEAASLAKIAADDGSLLCAVTTDDIPHETWVWLFEDLSDDAYDDY